MVVIGGVAFVVARPQINDFVNKEINKYGIELESWSIGLTGKANLHKVRLPMTNGTIITVREISVRPPVSSFKGVADLYDVKVEHGGISMQIPQLHVDGIVLNDKDETIKSKNLRLLMQIGLSSIRASNIELVSNLNGAQETATIKGFTLDNLDKGKIAFIGFDSMQTASDFKQGNLSGLQLQSGAASAKNIDVASAYGFMENILSQNQSIVDLFGPVNLSDVKIDAGLSDGKQLHVSLGALKSEGFSLRNLGQNPIAQAKAAIAVLKNANASKEERNDATKTLIQLLATIAKVNGSLENLVVDTADGKLTVGSFEITPSNWNNIIPEQLLIKADNVLFDLADVPNEKIEVLKEMGYNQLDLSFIMNLNWNSDDNSLNIAELGFTGKDMGQMQLSGKLKNIGPAFFAGNFDQMANVAEEISLQSLNLAVSDYGLFDKIIQWEAPKAGTTPSDLRNSIKIIAVESPPLLLKNHEDATAISNTFGNFVDNPGTINIQMVAKAPGGLSLSEFLIPQTDTSAILNKFDLKVTSTGKPN
ncbi:hypothetical protein N5853_10060 [Bartonella sp. HY329]|uniref:hypothetical protein n=1 Tax=unclassified Bartonella TaxID=2645622 RepID=UPI0021C7B612|nr:MULTISPECIES: hypothetical protein [unclassified Bartonella]UXM94445.1 hypothetical protein N5853_10060 [Bartonella sp. HY329]UXN08769.1 hypothetical protein N5852_10070 [Bartonella sp. HY328]